MNKLFLRLLQWSLAVTDIFVLNAVFLTATAVFKKPYLDISNIQYVYFIGIVNLTWLAMALLSGIYNERRILSFEHFTRASMHSYFYFVLLVEALLFFFRLTMLSRIFMAVVLSGIFIALMLSRSLYLLISHYLRKRDWLVDKVLIIGYNALAKRLVGHLADDGVNKRIIGFCEESENITELSGYPILSDIKGASEVCRVYGVNEIYSTIAPEQNIALYNLINTSEKACIRFKIVPDLSFFIKKQMYIDHYNDMPVLSLRREPLEDLGNRMKKRVFDVVLASLFLLLVMSWLAPLIALLIRIQSKGPVFFRQPRTGRNNQPFSCLKFRSMYVNEKAHTLQASRNDGRITFIGAFLRRTSLDELPQFINVLRGDMSIVGPRPHMLRHTDEYGTLIDHYMVRQFMKPGITGWAQIHGFRGETHNLWQMEKRVEHDLWYLEHWSLFLDIKIIILTALTVIKGDRNAY